MVLCISACWVISVVSDSLWPCGQLPTRLLYPWDSPGKNTRVGCHALLQGSSQARDRTLVSCGSCIAGGFFTDKPWGKPSGITGKRPKCKHYLWRVCCMTSQPKVSLASNNRLFISYLQVYDQIKECAFSQPKVVRWLVLSMVWWSLFLYRDTWQEWLITVMWRSEWVTMNNNQSIIIKL